MIDFTPFSNYIDIVDIDIVDVLRISIFAIFIYLWGFLTGYFLGKGKRE